MTNAHATNAHSGSDVAVMREVMAGARRLNEAFGRTLQRTGQLWCGLTGHHVLLRYEAERLSLECPDCGYESPGWDIGVHRTAK
jgi:hypothetical protein